MPSQLDLAKHRLFDKGGLDVRDIKLFPGSSREAPPEEIAREINKALAQIETGDYELMEEEPQA